MGRSKEQVYVMYVSAASAWEIAIKASLGRLRTTRSVAEAAAESGSEELPIRVARTRKAF